jgi:hypothetical protein
MMKSFPREPVEKAPLEELRKLQLEAAGAALKHGIKFYIGISAEVRVGSVERSSARRSA